MFATVMVVWSAAIYFVRERLPTPEEHFSSDVQKALIRAVLEHDAVALDHALAAGADINKVAGTGMTPLLLALAGRDLAAVRMLLTRGADPNVLYDGDRRSRYVPVKYAAYYVPDPRVLGALLRHGADPNGTHSDQTALHLSMFRRSTVEHTRLLIDHGANVNHRRSYGGTALALAVRLGAYQRALLLLQAGADPTIEDHRGKSALSKVQALFVDEMQSEGEHAAQCTRLEAFLQALVHRGHLEDHHCLGPGDAGDVARSVRRSTRPLSCVG